MLRYAFMDSGNEGKRGRLDVCGHTKDIYSIDITDINTVIKNSLHSKTISKAYENIQRKCSDDEKHLKLMIKNMQELIRQPEDYQADILADIYMGLLRAEKKYDIMPTDEMRDVWEQEACNSKIKMEEIKKRYPCVVCEDSYIKRIRGGCQEYHKLIMSQSNIGIFNFNDEVESIQRYAFPKTYDIYAALKDSPVENLILFEKTMGMGYANQIFHYTKMIKGIKTLEALQGIIRIGAEFSPFFLRKKLVDIIWPYLEQCNFDETCIEKLEDILDDMIPIFQSIYEDVLEFHWHIFYPNYMEDDRDGFLYNLKSLTKQQWESYFNEEEVYESYIKEENLHDWRNIKRLEDCFYVVEPSALYQRVLHEDKFMIRTIDGRYIEIIGGMPKNDIGEIVKRKAISKMERELELPTDIAELAEIYYKEREYFFEMLKHDEQEQWGKQDPKASAKKLKPIHIYAMVHKAIVETLNVYEEDWD